MKKLMMVVAAAALSLTAMAQTEKQDTISASFPGGAEAMAKYIDSNIRYPQTAINNGIEGVVNVKFEVHSDGTLCNFGIVRMVDPDLEGEALRLVKGMPTWIPAQFEGRPVDSRSTVRILFQLPE